MADRSIKVRLSAEVADFTREMGKATSSLDDLVKKSGDASGASNTTMGRLAQSARLQSDAWRTAGASLLGVGAAITGVNVAVAKTGIEYNTLQQKSRAALTTIMGGAREANEQMDKLDEFARTSPFSKAVFIEAQQQMLGFGIEAQKVIPYLSAINETIAATGGNNHDLAEIVRIFSQISAAGKITATDLMQFGQRGVDAATLIGSQMGMTGAQIRESITDGTLDANAALDALADGMQERFEGASAGVKNTMEGAFDRLKAAWRDLSASIMEPAVGQQGGGWLVDATNQVADLLRWAEQLPDPIKQSAGALSGLAGAGALAAGGVALAVPKIVEVHDAFKALNEISPRASSALGAVGKAAGAAAALIAGMHIVNAITGHFREGAPAADEYAAALIRVADAADGAAVGDLLDSMFTGVSSAMVGNTNDLIEAMQVVSQYQHDVIGNFFGVHAGFEDAISRFAEWDRQLAAADPEVAARTFQAFVDAAEAAGWTIDDLLKRFPEYAAALQLLAAENGLAELSGQDLIDAMLGLNPALVEAAAGAEEMGGAAGNAAGPTRDFAAEAEAAAEAAAQLSSDVRETLSSLNDYYSAALAASDATIAVEAAFDKAAEAAKENGEGLDLTTEKGRANQSALDGVAAAANRQAEAMLAAGESTESIVAATQRARDQFVDVAQKMGLSAGEAAALADKYGLIPDQVVTRLSQPGMEMSQEEAQAYRQMLANLPDEVRTHIKTIPDLSGYYDVDRALNRIAGRTVTTYVAMKQYGQGAVATGGRVGDTIPQLADGGSPRWVGASGRVFGPGSPTGDKVSAWISPDEFVVRARTAQRLGYDAMYALNAGRVPREALTPYLAAGGTPSVVSPLARTASATSSVAGDVTNVYQIDRLEFPGVRMAAEVERVMDRLPELAQQRGVRRG